MDEKFKLVDKEFKLGDSSLNVYKYRLLTKGFLFDEFKKNPVGYYMHGTKEFPREEGVLVKWMDLRVEGDTIYGKPCINLNHKRGQRTVDEIMSGHLNAASFGQLVALEVSSTPADYLPGQTGPTVSKWFPRECSLVDIPGNYCATAEDLVDEFDHPLNLADFNIKKITMEKIILTPAQLASIPNLKADATQTEVDAVIKDLIANAGKVPQLTQDLVAANTAKETAEAALKTYKETATAAQVKDLIDTAQTENRITKAAGDALIVQFAGNPDGLKNLLATFPPYKSITGDLTGTDNPKLKPLMAMSHEELDKAGKLEELKAGAPEVYFEKHEERYGTRHADDTRKK